MGYAIFVVGPAGSGKTTFCRNIVEHGANTGRSFKLANLDPANIDEETPYVLDIREHITVEDVQENTDLGPNGSLMLALNELNENIQEFGIEDFCGEYLLFDCPGQLELFTHSDAICNIAKHTARCFKTTVVYLMESQFLMDASKYVHGCLTALIAISKFELPHINILTKVDIIDPEINVLEVQENIKHMITTEDVYKKLTLEICSFLEENGMLMFKPLDWNCESTVFDILYEIDMLTGYFEECESREPRD